MRLFFLLPSFLLVVVVVNAYAPPCRRRPTFPTTALFSTTGANAQRAGRIFNALRPLIGYYAVMLAPIYGTGLAPFLGDMTDFVTLTNRCGSRDPNYQLCNERIVAPPNFTPARAQLARVYDVSAERLEQIADAVVQRQPRISVVGRDDLTHRREYVQRSLIFRFPDVITFQFLPVEGGSKSTLASHSRSIYGAGDLGVNKVRIPESDDLVQHPRTLTPPPLFFPGALDRVARSD